MSSLPVSDTEKVPANWPRRVWLPEALSDPITARIKELEIGTLSRYVVELIAYDLRERARIRSRAGCRNRPPEE